MQMFFYYCVLNRGQADGRKCKNYGKKQVLPKIVPFFALMYHYLQSLCIFPNQILDKLLSDSTLVEQRPDQLIISCSAAIIVSFTTDRDLHADDISSCPCVV